MSEQADALAKMEAVRVDTLTRLEGLSQAQLDWRPPRSGDANGEVPWSLGEVFMHLAISENYLRELIIWPLLEGVKPPEEVTFLPPPPPYGTKKHVILYWHARARAGTRRLIESWPADANLELTHVGGLRPATAIGWLLGAARHEGSHHAVIDALASQALK